MDSRHGRVAGQSQLNDRARFCNSRFSHQARTDNLEVSVTPTHMFVREQQSPAVRHEPERAETHCRYQNRAPYQ